MVYVMLWLLHLVLGLQSAGQIVGEESGRKQGQPGALWGPAGTHTSICLPPNLQHPCEDDF